MAGPETEDRRTERLFAVLGMGGSELGKVYLNVNKYIDITLQILVNKWCLLVHSYLDMMFITYLTSLNLTKCYKLVDINIPVYKEDLSDLAKYTEMFTFGQNRKKSHKIIFKCRFLPNKI